jgi:hemerythrin-like domain-containing protein
MTLRGICQNQCAALTQHHRLESTLIFPYLRDRQPDLGDVLDRLNEDHEVIHGLLEAVDAALVDLARTPTDYEPITKAVDQLTGMLLSHFAYEEQELFGPLSRHGFFPPGTQE